MGSWITYLSISELQGKCKIVVKCVSIKWKWIDIWSFQHCAHVQVRSVNLTFLAKSLITSGLEYHKFIIFCWGQVTAVPKSNCYPIQKNSIWKRITIFLNSVFFNAFFQFSWTLNGVEKFIHKINTVSNEFNPMCPVKSIIN